MLHIEFPRYKLRMQAAFTLMPWDLFLGESSRSSRLRPNRSLGFLLCFRNNFSQRYISIHPVILCTSTITPKFLNEWRTVVIVYTWAVKISPQHPCFCTRYHNRDSHSRQMTLCHPLDINTSIVLSRFGYLSVTFAIYRYIVTTLSDVVWRQRMSDSATIKKKLIEKNLS